MFQIREKKNNNCVGCGSLMKTNFNYILGDYLGE